MEGKVKWFSQEKGFGFIYGDDEIERFFHIRDVKGGDLPSNGDIVSFSHQDAKKGPRASDIEIKEKGKRKNSRKSDPRVVCSNCKKMMVPRVITGPPVVSGNRWTPVPKYSVCPFCAAEHEKFSASNSEKIQAIIMIAIFLAIILIVF